MLVNGLASSPLICELQIILFWFCGTLLLMRGCMGVASAYTGTEYTYM